MRPPGGRTALSHGEAAKCGWPRPKAGVAGAGATGAAVPGAKPHRGGRGGRGEAGVCQGGRGGNRGEAGAETGAARAKNHTGAAGIGAVCCGSQARIGAKTRRSRGKNHTGAAFSGENFREKGGNRGKKGGCGAADRGKKPQKAGVARAKTGFFGRYIVGA